MVKDDEAEAVVGRRSDTIAEPRGLTRVPSNSIWLSVVGVEEEEVDSTERYVVVAGNAEERLEGSSVERTVPVVVADRGEERMGRDPGREELTDVGLVGGDALWEGIHVVAHREDRGHAVEAHVVGRPSLDAATVAEVTDHSDSEHRIGGRHVRHSGRCDGEERTTDGQEGGEEDRK